MLLHGTIQRVTALQRGDSQNFMKITTNLLIRLEGGYFLFSDRMDTITAPKVSIQKLS